MGETEYIVNSLLCFINSACSGYSYDSLLDVVFSFYSHEEIKVAKELLCNLLRKDLIWRRDPEKKRRDLQHLLECHQELTASKKKVKIVTDSYKKMPPIGMSMFAPILSNLSEDITKINELLPKILDIKTEVCNTADTVRQMKMDIVDIRNKFKNAVSGMEEATKDMCDTEINVLEELQSFRQSIGPNDVFEPTETVEVNSARSYAQTVRMVHSDEGNVSTHNGQERALPVDDDVTSGDRMAATTAKRMKPGNNLRINRMKTSQVKSKRKVGRSENASTMLSSSTDENDNSWTTVTSKNQKRREKGLDKRNEKLVTRSRKIVGGSLRAATRTADVFIGRVDNDVSEDEIKDYIKANFNVDTYVVRKLNIRSEIYAAFKVNVKII